MLIYICPKCGRWLFSLGIAEAFAGASGGVVTQPCADGCGDMTPYKTDDRVPLPTKTQLRPDTFTRRAAYTWGRKSKESEIISFAREHEHTFSAWISPSYQQAKHAYDNIKKNLGDEADFYNTELRIVFKNGSRIRFYNSGNIDSIDCDFKVEE